jgi:hypothetical protein
MRHTASEAARYQHASADGDQAIAAALCAVVTEARTSDSPAVAAAESNCAMRYANLAT